MGCSAGCLHVISHKICAVSCSQACSASTSAFLLLCNWTPGYGLYSDNHALSHLAKKHTIWSPKWWHVHTFAALVAQALHSKTVYVHAAGEFTMVQRWDDWPRMHLAHGKSLNNSIKGSSRLAGPRRNVLVGNVTLLEQLSLTPSHIAQMQTNQFRLAWEIATIACIGLYKNTNETLMKSCRWTAMWDPSTSLKSVEYMWRSFRQEIEYMLYCLIDKRGCHNHTLYSTQPQQYCSNWTAERRSVWRALTNYSYLSNQGWLLHMAGRMLQD